MRLDIVDTLRGEAGWLEDGEKNEKGIKSAETL